jgi:hypothetical protein
MLTMYTQPGDVVWDVLGGSGAFSCAALLMGRRAIYTDQCVFQFLHAVTRFKELGVVSASMLLPGYVCKPTDLRLITEGGGMVGDPVVPPLACLFAPSGKAPLRPFGNQVTFSSEFNLLIHFDRFIA